MNSKKSCLTQEHFKTRLPVKVRRSARAAVSAPLNPPTSKIVIIAEGEIPYLCFERLRVDWIKSGLHLKTEFKREQKGYCWEIVIVAEEKFFDELQSAFYYGNMNRWDEYFVIFPALESG